jgi:hypothetical protein
VNSEVALRYSEGHCNRPESVRPEPRIPRFDEGVAGSEANQTVRTCRIRSSQEAGVLTAEGTSDLAPGVDLVSVVIERTKIFLKSRAIAGLWDYGDVIAGKQPSQCGLSGGDARLACKSGKCFVMREPSLLDR